MHFKITPELRLRVILIGLSLLSRFANKIKDEKPNTIEAQELLTLINDALGKGSQLKGLLGQDNERSQSNLS